MNVSVNAEEVTFTTFATMRDATSAAPPGSR